MTKGGRSSGLVEGLAAAYGLLPAGLRSALMPWAVPAYGAARRIGRAAAGIRKPVHWLEGRERTRGGRLSVLAVAEERALPFLQERAFRELNARERLGWAFPSSAGSSFTRHRVRADLVVVHGDPASCRGLSRRGFLAVPDWVAFGLDLGAGGRGWTPPPNKTVRENLRRVRKHGYSFEVTTDPDRFGRFYREMYLPFIPPRFGESAEVVGKRLMKLFFEGGVLLLVHRGGEEVAGNIILRFPGSAKSIILGLRGGDDDLRRKAALSASYYFTILWARDAGLERVDFGECRPFLDDGLFLFKKRWGMSVGQARLQKDAYLLKVARYGPAVRDFLAGNPFLFRHRGGLAGLVLSRSGSPPASGEAEAAARARLVPGMDRLFLLGESGFARGAADGMDERVVLVGARPEDFFRGLPAGLDLPSVRRRSSHRSPR